MIRCIAVDDEQLALDLLEDNIRKLPFLEHVKSCRSAFEAMEVLRSGQVDLIFLDIQMPDVSGIQLLRTLKSRPMVIFTTAYEKYATEGFNLDVIDYLLKPYPFERFLKAVNKAREYHDVQERALLAEKPKEPLVSSNYLFVRADYKLVKIDLSDILYVEGLKDYVKIVLADKPVLTQMSMKALEDRLPAKDFVRVHRSYIVAFSKIEYIQKQMLTIGKKEIPISDNYRESLFKMINNEKPID